MTIETLTSFFMWCTILNAGLLIGLAIWILGAPDLIYRLHQRWFPITREQHRLAMYAFLGAFKLVVIVFNLVPWIALLIVG